MLCANALACMLTVRVGASRNISVYTPLGVLVFGSDVFMLAQWGAGGAAARVRRGELRPPQFSEG